SWALARSAWAERGRRGWPRPSEPRSASGPDPPRAPRRKARHPATPFRSTAAQAGHYDLDTDGTNRTDGSGKRTQEYSRAELRSSRGATDEFWGEPPLRGLLSGGSPQAHGPCA